jgi:protein subunit release factor B
MDKMAELHERMKSLGITDDEFRETFIRSSGPGGQKVNKTASCVFLVHLPTGLSVKCQQDRSQALNRFFARRILLDRIEKLRTGVVAAKKMKEEKIKRQKRRRSRRAKEKILKEKHIIAKKKELRAGVDPDTV